MFRHVLGLVLLSCRTSATKDVELLMLPHEVAVLHRSNPTAALGPGGPSRVCRPRAAAAPRTAWLPPRRPRPDLGLALPPRSPTVDLAELGRAATNVHRDGPGARANGPSAYLRSWSFR